MFRGVTELTVDIKGRIAVPTRYRSELTDEDKQLIVTIDTEERCLLIYPYLTWIEIEKQIEALPSFNRAARRVQRLLIGHATEITLDSHARLLLPIPLREYANLDKQVVLIGQGRKFELWSEAHWAQSREQWLKEEAEDNSELPPSLLSLSL